MAAGILGYAFATFAFFYFIYVWMNDGKPIPETSAKVIKVTSAAELDAILSSNKRVAVDFYADWCPPCRAIAPVFSELAEKHAAEGKVAFVKVNTDHVKDVASRYTITAMPTFVFFRDGAPKGVAVPGIPAAQTLVLSGEGLVERIRGADPLALKKVIGALASS
ncbi:thioredoxin [Plectosphaerella cucumerina]|uniref:Thioredoxin n=1 Tax=Plectosphaerella cucumerina TaxID=40658 RepID=A0A8K0T8B9_9PEZI|nr:thioredoxin [Plectosphaerella cucumerina]